MCDAAHQLSDVAGFVISFLALYLTRKPATLKRSYGYHRADVLGALGSIMIIWGLLVWLLIEAVHRLLNPTDINGELMLITAIFGLGCNITNLVILFCCCNEKDEDGRPMNLFESVASAYKPFYGNVISNEIRIEKNKSIKGSFKKSVAERAKSGEDIKQVIEEFDFQTPELGNKQESYQPDSSQKSYDSPGVKASEASGMSSPEQKRLNGTQRDLALSN